MRAAKIQTKPNRFRAKNPGSIRTLLEVNKMYIFG